MTNNEINVALALAIGYQKRNVRIAPDAAYVVEVNRPTPYGDSWYRLDFTCPTVIWPIAKRYGFPSPISNGDFAALKRQGYGVNTGWEMYCIDLPRSTISKAKYLHYTADTPELCVALAVIGGAK